MTRWLTQILDLSRFPPPRFPPLVKTSYVSKRATSPFLPPDRVRAAGLQTIGLLGTRFTMEQDLYRDRLEAKYGLKVIVPPEADRQLAHRVIYEELCHGRVIDASRAEYRRIAADLRSRGCGGVILGCTEIAMRLGPEDVKAPVFDTATIHAEAAALCALANGASV